MGRYPDSPGGREVPSPDLPPLTSAPTPESSPSSQILPPGQGVPPLQYPSSRPLLKPHLSPTPTPAPSISLRPDSYLPSPATGPDPHSSSAYLGGVCTGPSVEREEPSRAAQPPVAAAPPARRAPRLASLAAPGAGGLPRAGEGGRLRPCRRSPLPPAAPAPGGCPTPRREGPPPGRDPPSQGVGGVRLPPRNPRPTSRRRAPGESGPRLRVEGRGVGRGGEGSRGPGN